MPLQDRAIMLLLKADCLSTAAIKAIKGGDESTALRMNAELQEVVREAVEIMERMQAQ